MVFDGSFWFESRWLPNTSPSVWVRTFLLCCQMTKKQRRGMSFSVSQLNVALEQCLANAANLCIFRGSGLVEAGGRLLYLISGSARLLRGGAGARRDGQRLIRGSPEQVGFAAMPQGFVKEEKHLSQTRPPITYLFLLSGWCVDSSGPSGDERGIVGSSWSTDEPIFAPLGFVLTLEIGQWMTLRRQMSIILCDR